MHLTDMRLQQKFYMKEKNQSFYKIISHTHTSRVAVIQFHTHIQTDFRYAQFTVTHTHFHFVCTFMDNCWYICINLN